MQNKKELLPKWIRFFCWLFLFFLLSPLILPLAMWLGPLQIRILGWSINGGINDPSIWISVFLLTSLGVSAFGLLWGKPWAIGTSLFSSSLLLILEIISTVKSLFSPGFYLGLAPFFIVPFIYYLLKVRPIWNRRD